VQCNLHELRPNGQINVWEDGFSGAFVANGETPEALLDVLTALVEKG
jgi:hypothetical protein